jgi:hypothetical protein
MVRTKLECLSWNLTKKSRTDQDPKWDEIYSELFCFFLTSTRYIEHSRWNKTKLTTFINNIDLSNTTLFGRIYET